MYGKEELRGRLRVRLVGEGKDGGAGSERDSLGPGHTRVCTKL
jgi:hypothetical protein